MRESRRRGSTRLLELPENRAAVLALLDFSAALLDNHHPPLLYLHGPTGSGKTCLIDSLVSQLSGGGSDLVIQRIDANELNLPPEPRTSGKIFAPSRRSEPADDWRIPARDCDLLIIEDLQHLGHAMVEPLSELLDDRLKHGRGTVLSALLGPQHLAYRGSRFSPRFTSRLAGGLVCHILPLQPESRMVFLREMASRKALAVSDQVLLWLAENITGGGRQLLAALERCAALHSGKLYRHDAALIAAFQAEGSIGRPDLEGITRKVCDSFQVSAELLLSASRLQHVLLPRQISMYLARQLTGLSLDQIGDYFGGRDHTTVLHACRKVQQTLAHNPQLEGLVRQIHAELA